VPHVTTNENIRNEIDVDQFGASGIPQNAFGLHGASAHRAICKRRANSVMENFDEDSRAIRHRR
jgi:hypothetical protein